MEKIIVAHPEKQHSYYMAEAANKAGLLERYITTVYYKKKSFTKFLDEITKHRFRLNIIRKMKSVEDRKIQQFCELRGLFLLLLRRTRCNKLINHIQDYNVDIFGRKVARYAKKHNVNAVVMYDTSSLVCFRELQNTGIIRIMDTSIANRAYTKAIYESVISEDDWKYFSEKDILLNNYEMKRLLDEIYLTDYFIVPSEFVKKSLIFSGVSKDKIFIVPYGVDTEFFKIPERRHNSTGDVLELLIIGELSYRKGVNYLLEAVFKFPQIVNLTLVGGYQGIFHLYKKYKDCTNIHFLGRIPHDQLVEIYQKADIFVLPSLSEGLARVGLEAMACGLPLLCSKNCGVNDLVEEGVNGWILPEISSSAIVKKLNFIFNNKEVLPKMGEEARIAAEKYNWDNYNELMKKVLSEILGV